MNFTKCIRLAACLLLMVGMTYAAKGGKKRMSIDKMIMDAAPDAQMFDVFHVMPEGDLKIMTEYDMLLTLDQYKKMRGPKTKGKSSVRSRTRRSTGGGRRGSSYPGFSRRQKRKADSDTSLLWPDCTVYYEVDKSFLPEDVNTVELAIAEWERFTCLNFEPSKFAQSRLQFKNGAGCYSMLGRQPEPQTVALAPGCRTKGIIAHEIGHAIGWYHEHMRPDRDNYISINFDAIPMRFHVNFDKYTTDIINDYGVEYDYTSLMHYGNDALPGSITALDPSFQDKMGQREGLTFKDIKLANLMYECASFMKCELKQCNFGGFQLYKAHKTALACECWCDSGDVSDPLVLCSELDSAPPQPSIRPTETPVVDLCYDVRDDCQMLKDKGYCMSKLAFMMDICKQTCGLCSTGSSGGREVCMDHDKGCEMMAAAGLCVTLEPVMQRQCPASCDLCSSPPDPCEIQKNVMASLDYIPNGIPRSAGVSLLPVVVSIAVATLSLA